MLKPKGAAAAVLVSLAILVSGAAAGASDVTEAVRATVDRVIEILNDPGLQGPEHKAERRGRVMSLISERFDFEELSRRTLARHWRKRTDAEKEEFVGLYTRFLQDFYMDRIEDNRRQKVVYTGETLRGKVAEVQTLVVTAKGLEVPINYRLKQGPDGWKVYDVVIEGVSLVRSYRTQFGEVIQKGSYEGLIKMLREKVEGD
ncbi:MAG: phospholipid-binding protein MlaC [Thermodesulfobacteriota bacterium]